MLRWRLLLGTIAIAVLVGLCVLDARTTPEGVWLFPLAVVVALLSTQEALVLVGGEAGVRRWWHVYFGSVLIVALNWVPVLLAMSDPLAWPLAALGFATILAFRVEIARYRAPGRSNRALAIALFSLVYVGVLLSFLVQIRLRFGVGALAIFLVAVKAGDTGAYTVGRLVGRHKMAPYLSPGKTLEGAAGAILFAAAASWIAFWAIEGSSGLGAVIFGVVMGLVGLFGDLAESLLKRDAGQKDSSRWMPGFGGVLDMVDSLLLAAPVAWAWLEIATRR